METLGSGAMTNDFVSIQSADVMLVIGSNTTESHPVIGSFIKERKERGGKLIVCDPRQIEMSKHADIAIQQRSGTDIALLNGMMHVIIQEGLYNAQFVAERVENFDALKELVAQYTPEKVSEITGVPASLIIEAARLYAKGPNSAIFYTMGITQHICGTSNVRSIANLALICGMFGRPGTGVNPLRGQNNVQGACDMGCVPTWVPGYQRHHVPEVQAKVREIWGHELPMSPGKTVVRMTDAAEAGQIKALYIIGENPMVSDPNTNHVRRALHNLDFLVVQDIFLTETAQLADVVFPAACWVEKDGTFTNTCRAVQRVRKVVQAPGEAKPDWQILTLLAQHCGTNWTYQSAEEIFQEICRFVPSYHGITYAKLDNAPIHWPCPTEDHPGTPILHTTKFPRASGKAKVVPCEWQKPHEWPDQEFPYLGITGRILYHYHSGSMTRRSAPKDFIPELFIEISPEDATQLQVTPTSMIKVTSRRGSIEGKVKITERVPKQAIFIPFHFSEAPANALTASQIDPVSETPAYKINAVKIEKIS